MSSFQLQRYPRPFPKQVSTASDPTPNRFPVLKRADASVEGVTVLAAVAKNSSSTRRCINGCMFTAPATQLRVTRRTSVVRRAFARANRLLPAGRRRCSSVKYPRNTDSSLTSQPQHGCAPSASQDGPLLYPGPLCGGEAGPTGRAAGVDRGSTPFRQHRDVLSKSPVPTHGLAGHEARQAPSEVSFSLGYCSF